MDSLSIYDLFPKEESQIHLPVLISPSPCRRTKSICKNNESRFILSNSIDESFPRSQPRSPLSTKCPLSPLAYYPPVVKKASTLKYSIEEPMEIEMRRAIKTIISQKPKIHRIVQKKTLASSSLYAMRNSEEADIGNFVKAIFSHEPSPYRKMGLTAEPKTLDLRAAEKILQEAKKIIKHGVLKKSNQQEGTNLIEEFWRTHISKEEFIRWDVFEESFLSFIENFMVSNYGVLRKLNWKSMFFKIHSKISKQTTDFEIWPPSKCQVPKITSSVVNFLDFASFVVDGSLCKLLLSCLEDMPYYIENLRKGQVYQYICGCFYKGEWKDGKREGNGVFELCSGEKYFGGFVRGLRQEFGAFSGHGFEYKGEFKKDKFNGYGKIKFPDSSSFDGIWVKHRFLKGKFFFCDGSVYNGEWNQQEFEGRGKLVMIGGNERKGMWRRSKLCGDGAVKDEGRVVKGFYLDDVLQTEYKD